MFSFIKKMFGEPTDFKKLVSEGAIIIDVRSIAEYKSGHIPGSINIPLDSIQTKMEELKKKNKLVITVCRSGARSSVAKSQLSANGIKAFNGGPWNSLLNKIR